MDVVAEEDIAAFAARLGLPLERECRGCSATVASGQIAALVVNDDAVTVRCDACAANLIGDRA